MPKPGMLWRHVVINARRTWLHGDPRGFRSRQHRIHSSGDYKKPPPKGEHEDLHRYHVGRSGKEITFDLETRKQIGIALREHFRSDGHRTVVLAVGKVHAHVLVELPQSRSVVKQIVGRAKRKSSRAVKSKLPGSIWADGGSFEIVSSPEHFRKAEDYILYDQGPWAWTWSYKDSSDEGMFRRKRPKK